MRIEYIGVMIYRCPYCGRTISPALHDGLTTCNGCNRIFSTSQFHRLLSAAWVIRREHTYDPEVLKYRCHLSQEEANMIYHFVAEECYSHDELLKELTNNKLQLDQPA